MSEGGRRGRRSGSDSDGDDRRSGTGGRRVHTSARGALKRLHALVESSGRTLDPLLQQYSEGEVLGASILIEVYTIACARSVNGCIACVQTSMG